MQEYQKEEEKRSLQAACEIEDLLEKKTRVYARLLTDAALAKDLEELSKRHQKRKETLSALISGNQQKKKKEGGMFALKDKEEGE